MTIAELKKELAKYPDNADVLMADDFGYTYIASRVEDWSRFSTGNAIMID